MLSLRVPEPEAQLKLTTPEALQPSLEPTLCLFRLFCLTHYFSSLTYFLSTRPLLPCHHGAPLLFPFLLICDSTIPLSNPSSLSSSICSPSLLCSAVFFPYCHMAMYHLWAHIFFPSHLGNSCAGHLRTPISEYCSFLHLIHGPLHVEAISRPHLFHLKHIW